MKQIRYIGHKIRKTDTIGPNPHKYVWEGHGAVIDVDDADAARFLLHPAVWELVVDKPKRAKPKPKPVKATEEEAPPPIKKRGGGDRSKVPPPIDSEEAPVQGSLEGFTEE